MFGVFIAEKRCGFFYQKRNGQEQQTAAYAYHNHSYVGMHHMSEPFLVRFLRIFVFGK
jgi:hypothetical protein